MTNLTYAQLKFLQVNVMIVIALVEIELVVGIAPNNPIVRHVHAFTSHLLLSGVLILHYRYRNSNWLEDPIQHVLSGEGTNLAFVEDVGAIEGQGGLEYRTAVIKKYETSTRFRRMMLFLSWEWGLVLICIAIVELHGISGSE